MQTTICPFCGSDRASPVEVDLGQWTVVCPGCNATGPTAPASAAARRAWNQRCSVRIQDNSLEVAH